MRELRVITGYGLLYLFLIVLMAAGFLGVLYLIGALGEFLAAIIPSWLALSGPSLIILITLCGVCGGRMYNEPRS